MGKLLEDNSKERVLIEGKEQKRQGGAGSVEEAIQALSALSTIIRRVASTLSGRFQRKGWAHFESLGHLVSGSQREDALKRYEDKNKNRNKSMDKDKDKNITTSGCDDDVILPAAVYKVRVIRMHCSSVPLIKLRLSYGYLPSLQEVHGNISRIYRSKLASFTGAISRRQAALQNTSIYSIYKCGTFSFIFSSLIPHLHNIISCPLLNVYACTDCVRTLTWRSCSA